MSVYRSKVDNIDDLSISSGLFCNEEEDMTRQEFADEVNVNNVVARHGAGVRPVQYGEWDFTHDLTESMQSVRAVAEAYEVLPQEIRVKYPDMAAIWAAIASGDLKIGSVGVEVPSSPAEPGQAPDEGARQS